MNLVIWCDGDSHIGMGHVNRCLNLATQLHHKNINVIFYTTSPVDVVHLISSRGFEVFQIAKEKSLDCLEKFLLERSVKALVIDERVMLQVNHLKSLKNLNIDLILIDDLSEKRLVADLLFYPPIEQVDKLDWKMAQGKVFSGWEWVLLGQVLEIDLKKNQHPKIHPRILLTTGGADVWRLTKPLVLALDLMEDFFSIDVVINKRFEHYSEVLGFLKRTKFSHEVSVIDSPNTMMEHYKCATFCVSTFGVSAYEIAASSKYSILITTSEDHHNSAKIFEKNGISDLISVKCGVIDDSGLNRLTEVVKKNLLNKSHLIEKGRLHNYHIP